ncbi:DNA cytosine methyltransferase [Dyadobacter sp. 3J3]|uniref:DNA cytosine methyltransferase n=1 Tax=Dyadobacter sp. 3J3 TaxID=2606600 RepID=UPI0013580EEC|nr:DNA cytosine methyltransferase [Dyadobacter sp. 3J3]
MIISKNKSGNPKYIVIDLFCGAGGTTTGFDMAMINGQKAACIAACVNHDPLAIESHWKNHPDVLHFLEDITKLYGQVVNGILFQTDHMRQLVRLVEIYRAAYPDAKIILWASLECTNFSKAKGGQARDADSRTLADHLDRYVAALDPDYVQIENVVEFMSWGPMKDGKPVSKKNGQDWIRWKQHLCSFGYRDEWKELNSADFGAYTSRNRLFGVFAKPGMPIIWPQPSHSKKPSSGSMFGDLKKWKAVKDVLDFEDEGLSIFNRKKPLVDPSLERIYAGLVKFVAGGKEAFILKYNSTDGKGYHNPPSIDEPCPTIACQNRLGLVNTSFIAKYYSGKPAGKVIPVTGPSGTITCTDGQALVNVKPFVMNTNFKNVGKSINEPAATLVSSRRHPYLLTPVPYLVNYNHSSVTNDIELPAPTLVCKDKLALINPSFLTKYHGTGENINSIESPASTLSTKDRLAKVQAVWFDKTYTGNGNISSIENPAGTLMPIDKHRLINCEPIILNPSHGGHTMSTNGPCPVIIARQDKAPLYLIQFKIDPEYNIPVYDDDSEVMVRIKIFMSIYGIADIKMRMLKVLELLKIQGFPANYVLAGNQSDQKKFIGNSVVPHVVRAWTEAMSGKTNLSKVA